MRVIGIVLGVIEHLDSTILIDNLYLHARRLDRQRSDGDHPHTMNNLNNNMAISLGIDVILNWEQTFIFTKVLSLRMPTGQGKRKMLAALRPIMNYKISPALPWPHSNCCLSARGSSLLLGNVANKLSAVRRSEANRRG
jgi:hypothetical protein